MSPCWRRVNLIILGRFAHLVELNPGNSRRHMGVRVRHNSENTENYINHPFRLFGIGKPTDLSLAQQTYLERHSPCNDGWCQDVIQAAMLNLTDEAASMIAQRAAATDHGGFRFSGFARGTTKILSPVWTTMVSCARGWTTC